MTVIYAFILDLLIGDPRYSFHPVKLMGKMANFLEEKFNSSKNSKLNGVICASVLYLLIAACFYLVSYLLKESEYGYVVEIILFYTTIALHDLIKHGYRVYRSLKQNKLSLARINLSYFVGRDTKDLSEKEICRAVLESLSENLVDGVTAPLFYGVLFGLPGAFVYKMINTLDSLWGYKNKRFSYFGYFAAKVDDVANYLPARITAPLIIIVGSLFTLRFFEGFKILKRDGQRHPSPNSGLSEAALAGVLGVRLGGENYYNGNISKRPFLGDEVNPLSLKQIEKTFIICILSSLIFLILLHLIYVKYL